MQRFPWVRSRMNLPSIFKAILDKFDVVLLKEKRHVKVKVELISR